MHLCAHENVRKIWKCVDKVLQPKRISIPFKNVIRQSGNCPDGKSIWRTQNSNLNAENIFCFIVKSSKNINLSTNVSQASNFYKKIDMMDKPIAYRDVHSKLEAKTKVFLEQIFEPMRGEENEPARTLMTST